MSKKKSKKAAGGNVPRERTVSSGTEKKETSADAGLYYWLYVIGGILLAIGVFTMYLHHTIPGLVLLVIGAVMLFYGNKNKGGDIS